MSLATNVTPSHSCPSRAKALPHDLEGDVAPMAGATGSSFGRWTVASRTLSSTPTGCGSSADGRPDALRGPPRQVSGLGQGAALSRVTGGGADPALLLQPSLAQRGPDRDVQVIPRQAEAMLPVREDVEFNGHAVADERLGVTQ